MEIDDLKNMLMLYSDLDDEVYQALNNKKNWILHSYYVKGHLSTSEDHFHRLHYVLIEAMLDDVLLFRELNAEDVKDSERLPLWRNQYKILDLYEEIPTDAPFVIEYDFSLLDRQAYNALMPNFYFGHEIEAEDDHQSSIVSLLKMLLNKDHPFILLENSLLINNSFFAPIISKIIVFQTASKELQEELKAISLEKEIDFEYHK